MADAYANPLGSNTSPFNSWGTGGTNASGLTAIMTAATSTSGSLSGAATTWVDKTYAEGGGAALTVTFQGSLTTPHRIVGVTNTGSLPVAADRASGAAIATTGSFALTLAVSGANACNYVSNIAFSAGTGAGAAANLNVTSAQNQLWTFDTCSFAVPITANASVIQFGTSTNVTTNFVQRFELYNCTMTFGSASAALVVNGELLWRGGSFAASGALPTAISIQRCSKAVFEGIDFSTMAGKTIVTFGLSMPSKVTFKDCKMPSTAYTRASSIGNPGQEVLFTRTDSAGTNWVLEKYAYGGSQIAMATAIRTGGAAGPDGTGIGWRVLTDANPHRLKPYEGIPFSYWFGSGAQTIDIYGGIAAAALPTNIEMWFDIEYLGAAGNPQGSWNSTVGSIVDGTGGGTVAADTSAWDTGATARANSTAYNAGDVIKVASNTGRLFVCTTAGTTAGSEPAGYASATDGGTVTDNTATFTALNRFKVSLTLSPNPGKAGLIFIYPRFAKTSTYFFLDPKPV